MEEPQEQITVLLAEIAAADQAAKERLISRVYGDLHRMARVLMAGELERAPGWSPTAGSARHRRIRASPIGSET